jgi:threonine synthase
MTSTLTHLECTRCGAQHAADRLQNLCTAKPASGEPCGGPLFARYDLAAAARLLTPQSLLGRAATMWRYAELLPAGEPVTLGEGMTPLVRAGRLGLTLAQVGAKSRPEAGVTIYLKDEGLNPTGSFKARGLSAAVTRAKALGAKTLAIPTAGNAGGALAAYAARAGLKCVVVMPADTPAANVQECRAFGADVRKLDGLISDCGRYVAKNKEKHGWFEVSTLKEPYRIEGKKTMAFEVWEQLGGSLPDVIVYPCGGGVGLIAMWKAFDEMEALGWIGAERPRMVAVQAAGCAPIVEAFHQGAPSAEFWQYAETVASGLRVPKALGDFLILAALRESKGTAVAVSDAEMLAAGRELAALEGMFAAPEGAATLVAAKKLAAENWIQPGESVVLFITGSGYKYSEAWEAALGA